MKLFSILLLASVSLNASAELIIEQSIRKDSVEILQESKEVAGVTIYESVREESTSQASSKETIKDTSLPPTEIIETLQVSKDTYEFVIKPTIEAQLYNLKITYDNKVISNGHYFARNVDITHKLKLSQGQGTYDITYTEYDSTAIYKNVILIKKYKLTYKNPEIIQNAKVSRNVQAKDPKIVELAANITGNTVSEMDKVELINQWIVDNVTYNYSKTAFSQKIDALTTLEKKNAICTGYANLFAALARASGLETKVMTGKARSGKKSLYHQWNEVKIDGIWYFIDTTWNAGTKQGPLTFFSKASNYPKSHYRPKEVRSY